MAPRRKVFNNPKLLPNPWRPYRKSFYTPSKQLFVPLEESHNVNKNICRLSLLFPSIKIHYIIRILKIHHQNLTEAIDMLLFIRSIQKQRRDKQNQQYTPFELFRKTTCARCAPIYHQPLIQRILEEDAIEENRAGTILPNITFGSNNTNTFYEHDLHFSVPSVQKNHGLNIAHPERTEMPINEEIIEVDDVETPGPSRTSGNIKLRVLKKVSGQYTSHLMQ